MRLTLSAKTVQENKKQNKKTNQKKNKTGGVDQSERSTHRFSISLNEALTEDAASWSSDNIPDLIEREFMCKNIPNAEKSKHLLFSFDILSKTLLAWSNSQNKNTYNNCKVDDLTLKTRWAVCVVKSELQVLWCYVTDYWNVGINIFYFSVEKALFISGGGVFPASYKDSGGGELKQHQSGIRPIWL